MPDWQPKPEEAVLMSGIYGLVTLALMFILTGIITPSRDDQMRGWRRARKQGMSIAARIWRTRPRDWCTRWSWRWPVRRAGFCSPARWWIRVGFPGTNCRCPYSDISR